jgi:FMN phosphatase YigB (HAD superfamily)
MGTCSSTALENKFCVATGIRALVFDMDDVLYDATVWQRWLAQLLGRLGKRIDYHEFFQTWERDYHAAACRGEFDMDHALRSFLHSQGFCRGMIDEVAAASQTQRRELTATIRLLPGVRSTLKRLKERGLKLAVVANVPLTTTEATQRLRKLGLSGTFAAVVTSFELRQTMPDELPYRTVLDALQTLPAETAMISHDETGLLGARRAGMNTIAFNFDAPVEAAIHLQRIEELYPLIAGADPRWQQAA